MPKFVPRQRKHKAIARQKAQADRTANSNANDDANAAEILPEEQKLRNARKAEMKEELAREAQGKMSSKKKKRLDKYIVWLSCPINHVHRVDPVNRIPNSRKKKTLPS